MSAAFRFIHAADLHLDSPFRGLAEVPDKVGLHLRESTFAALRRLTDVAIERQVDFIVLAGDLYDAADRSLRAQLALQREWSKLQSHGIQVFAIHGNHDPLSGSKAKLDIPDSVTVFGAEASEGRPAYRRDGELAAYIYGISYGTRAVTDNLAARYVRRPDGPFHIALLHANVDGDPSHDPYSPCRLDELTGAGFDYWALGHIHDRRVLHEYPHVAYSGNTQGRNPRETGSKGCYIVDVTESREVNMRFEPLDEIRFARAELDITGLDTEQALLEAMQALGEQTAAEHEGRHVMLKMVLLGRGGLHGRLSNGSFTAELLAELRERWDPEHTGSAPWLWMYALECLTGAELRTDELAGEDSFAGELYRMALALSQQPDRRQAFMREALASLSEQPRLRRLFRDKQEQMPGDWFEQAVELVLGLLLEEELEQASAEPVNPDGRSLSGQRGKVG
ncbi:metallophosphoesterase family protein [Paenibacillus abyssi]|uniref:Exonuclease SbcCD subunit D n=1 Tax=Paenibacillus abyssi TaxID=1340531 RepID=A0A917FZ44_9BACL|nr:DNA repair exonuclease [Paenibacillus abyssi]GGG14860.1 exonuclease SbcCD subunit D [Paenibacillus abyssi]